MPMLKSCKDACGTCILLLGPGLPWAPRPLSRPLLEGFQLDLPLERKKKNKSIMAFFLVELVLHPEARPSWVNFDQDGPANSRRNQCWRRARTLDELESIGAIRTCSLIPLNPAHDYRGRRRCISRPGHSSKLFSTLIDERPDRANRLPLCWLLSRTLGALRSMVLDQCGLSRHAKSFELVKGQLAGRSARHEAARGAIGYPPLIPFHGHVAQPRPRLAFSLEAWRKCSPRKRKPFTMDLSASSSCGRGPGIREWRLSGCEFSHTPLESIDTSKSENNVHAGGA
ncbi:hypothetical protein IE81DRAFT_17286 [Ceraceosorus guamensis]|uniref:Uncharacterized protein n=1 Tax=Ceraceosorus guamensis TaxID=1522189 RepID=A0A316VQS6_9BASI|nr:hypothetical protein IE81DRAFT_17286 [Ceraceosorus guamensis]PWN39564.1 hypothetical protein IE81DRAFT_17286 [Ceraceosorus guamensis]